MTNNDFVDVCDDYILDLDDYPYCFDDDFVSNGEFSIIPEIQVDKYGAIKVLNY